MSQSCQPGSPQSAFSAGWLQHSAGSPPPRLVIKFGGSLLARSDWPALFASLIAEEHAGSRPTLIVVGGGAPVEGLRQLDATCPQPPERMHRLALNAMQLTARLVAETLSLPLTTSLTPTQPAILDLPAAPAASTAIAHLPHSWDVTSDSLAAAVAQAIPAELLLVKSVPPPAQAIDQLADCGWIDRHFPAISSHLTIRWRSPSSSEETSTRRNVSGTRGNHSQ